jgi:hypothetical protein
MVKNRGFYIEVLDDVLTAIQKRDWVRGESVSTGERFYVFGWKCMELIDWFDHELPPAGGEDQSLMADWLKKARSASAIPDYMARILAEYAAVDPELRQTADRVVDWWRKGRPSSTDEIDEWAKAVSPLVWADVKGRCRDGLFGEFVQALRVQEIRRTGGEPPEGAVDAGEQQLLFLREALTKVGKAVERSGGLEPLTFADPLLEEATRCFLYQFYRATVLLCSTALESRLKALFGDRDLFDESKVAGKPYYKLLVREAVRLRFLPEECKGPADEVFVRRHIVAHDGKDPEMEAAQVVLDATRLALKALTPPSA